MIVIAGAVIGALFGGFLARKRKGRGLDIAQYAVVYAMIFAVIGLFITLFVHRAAIM